MSLLLGCIADDFTGATDLASTLVRAGMRTVQWIGVPESANELPRADAMVVALKSRTIAPETAVEQSVNALRILREAGARQIFFKYCSTFDSTPRGNIGPVIEALLGELNSDFTVACPAFPANGRTVYQGNLFVNGVPLSESGMKDHPLTPMTDSNLVRLLGTQMTAKVGLIPYESVEGGSAEVQRSIDRLRQEGVRCAIVDALNEVHLNSIGRACLDMPLVTGGSGVALGLPANFEVIASRSSADEASALPAAEGPAVVLAGSCSSATLGQIEQMKIRHPSYFVDPLAMSMGDRVVDEALDWAGRELDRGPLLIYSSMSPAELADVQAAIGIDRAGHLVEEALAQIAAELVESGVRKLVVAGGETSGAVVSALCVKALRIGPEIDPGVPWTLGIRESDSLYLALKSGNFGSEGFFEKAVRMIQ